MTIQKRVLAGTVGLLAASFALAMCGGAASAGSAALTDPRGDAAGAPDITAVSLSDVPHSGALVVSVTASGLVASTSVDVWLDTDKNDSTGSASGSEYLLEVWQEADDWGWTIEKWNGSDWKMIPDAPTQRFSRSGDTFTWTLNKSDLGGAGAFAFYVAGYLFNEAGDDVTSRDLAPDGGSWAYDLSGPSLAQPVKAVVAKPLAVPAKPRAGTLLSLTFPVTSDTGQALSGARLTATTKIGSVTVPHTQSLSAGAAAVNVLIPKKAKGKVLTVTVRISVGGQTTTRVVSFRIA
jgi:hypothetical protein